MAFKSIGQRMGFVSIADAKRKAEATGHRKGMKEGLEKGLEKGREKERENSEKTFKLWVQRVSKKLKVSQKELLALKP